MFSVLPEKLRTQVVNRYHSTGGKTLRGLAPNLHNAVVRASGAAACAGWTNAQQRAAACDLIGMSTVEAERATRAKVALDGNMAGVPNALAPLMNTASNPFNQILSKGLTTRVTGTSNTKGLEEGLQARGMVDNTFQPSS